MTEHDARLCSPVAVVDIMMRSSAYSSSKMSTPDREGASWLTVSICSRPSTNTPNRIALSGQPSSTPIKQSKVSEMPSEFGTAALSLAYQDLMQSRIGPHIPTHSSTCHSKPRGTIKCRLEVNKTAIQLFRCFPSPCLFLLVNQGF